MFKKLLTLTMGLGLALSAFAQWGASNPRVSQDDILFWTGKGSNRAVIAITWNDAVAGNIGFAWGVQWNGSNILMRDIMDTIAAYDSRLTITWNSSHTYINNLTYTDAELGLDIAGVLDEDSDMAWWFYNWKDASDADKQSVGIMGDVIANGDFVDWLPMDPETYESYPADEMFMATNPNGSTSTNYPFAESSVQYWAGSGSNSAVVGVGFNGTVLVWGVRWSGNVHVSDLLDTINTLDSRMQIDGISDCYADYMEYSDGTTSYETEGAGIMYKVNNTFASSICSQNAADGDYIFFSDNFSFPANSYIFVSTPNGGDTPNPNTRPIAVEDIQYWVGSGDGSSVVVVSWDDEADDVVVLAWGVHYDDEYYPSVIDLLDTIKQYDSRFDYSVRHYMGEVYDIHTITYEDGTMSLAQTNTSQISVQVITEEQTDDVSGSELEDYSIWDGDMVTISTSGLFLLDDVEAVLPPSTPDPQQPCEALALPYEENFSGYTDDQSVRPYEARAQMPTCWTILGNGTTQYIPSSTSTNSTYFGGIGYSTSTNSFGAIAAYDPFLSLIGSQIYTGSNASHTSSMTSTGTRRYAMLPTFEQPLSQTMLTFDHRTSGAGARLVVGYVISDTASFVGLDTMAADNRVLHHDTVHFANYANLPANARLTFMWEVTSSTSSTTGPGNRYCGIDNLKVELDANAPEPAPIEATIAASDILYWVGEGSNEAILAVNWADTALAWGYRFNGTKTVSDMMSDIATDDPRFSYVMGSYGLDDIRFAVAEGDTLHKQLYSYWESKNNGIMDAGMTQVLVNGDVEKWAEPAAGVVVDSSSYEWEGQTHTYYTYVYPMTIHPVSVPQTTPETPVEATIAASDILYWVGEGSNEAILAVNWADTALAWGYRFNGTKTVSDMMSDIATDDPRFSYVMGSYGLDDIRFAVAEGDTLHKQLYSYWESKNNGIMDAGMTQVLVNGDVEKWAEPAAGVVVDSSSYEWEGQTHTYYTYVYPMTIHPVSVPQTTPETPVEATIAASDILYWVGEGSNEAILAVNWADTALAWGYRFNGTKTVNDMMSDIATDDPRFSYVMGSYGLDDIRFAVAEGDTLHKQLYSYWESKNNGIVDAGMTQVLVNGDVEKWAEPAAGVVVDSSSYEWEGQTYTYYTYVYPMTIHPVSVPDTTGVNPPQPQPEHGPFCGAVGTEGCDAIRTDSTAIVAWATACTVVRGLDDIAVPNGPYVTYGEESMAVGPAGFVTTTAVSLGDGGTATVTFAKPIRNGEGPDFAVFENSFNDYFLELAFVEVSTDGERFVRFPATSLSQTDSQIVSHVDPTFINNLAGKYRVGYGTPFDLEELSDSTGIDINNINYVRLVDVVGSINPQYATYDAFGHIVNDPYPTSDPTGMYLSGGFDLTGVAVLYENENVAVEEVETVISNLWPNPTTNRINVVSTKSDIQAMLFDMNGRTVSTLTLRQGNNSIDLSTLAPGVYMLRAEGTALKVIKQ